MGRRVRIAWMLPILLTLPLLTGAKGDSFEDYTVVKVEDGPNVLNDLKAAFINAEPGTLIQLPAAEIDVDEELSLFVDHVVVRGKGMRKTVLNFSGQVSGGQAILATGDHVAFVDFAVIDPPGDAIKVEGSKGVLFDGMKVEWTGGPSAENGAYGLYPVLCEDVLVMNSRVIGASDAGIYVGQSTNIVVKKNKVKDNVAGIEIENSDGADVFKNVAKNNTGGVLVFNLPNLTMQGAGTRVFKNKIIDNNTFNFGSGTVGEVPPGTGVIILANDDVHVFGNKIKNNKTVGVTSISYNLIGSFSDADYDPYNEGIWVFGNEYENNGYAPEGQLGTVASAPWGFVGRDVFIARDVDPAKEVGGELPQELRHCVRESNKNSTFGTLNLVGVINDGEDPEPTEDRKEYKCDLDPLPKIKITDSPPPPSPDVAAACTPGSGTAYEANCPKLSDFDLFVGNDPHVPDGDAGGVPYDLTTPLFSDFSGKYRAVFVPDGQTVPYDADSALDLPVGTILTKTFAYSADLAAPGENESLIETRLLIHREKGWVGLPYIWNAQETEAYLSVIGGLVEVEFTHEDGTDVALDYRVPNANMCERCHFDGPIGPKVRLLNRDFDYAGGTENQITHWANAGLLTDAPDPSLAPRIPVWNDEADGTLEERAKGYIETNCAHCHNPEGGARNTGLYLEWDRPIETVYGVCKPPVAAGQEATGGLKHAIVPGSADESIFVYRMDATDPNAAMPELARALVHDEGVALIAEWIDSLPPVVCQ